MQKIKEYRKLAVIAVLASVLTAMPFAYRAYADSVDTDSPPADVITNAPADDDSTTGSLTVITTVTNDDGGTAAAGDFTVQINNADGLVSQFAGDSSAPVTLDPGDYTVTVSALDGYTVALDANCIGTITIAAGDNKACAVTISDNAADNSTAGDTNDDQQGQDDAPVVTSNPVVDILDAIRIATAAHDQLADPSQVIKAQVKLEQFEGDALAYNVVFADGWHVFIRASDSEILSMMDASHHTHQVGSRGLAAVNAWRNDFKKYWGYRPTSNNYSKPKHDNKKHHDQQNDNGWHWSWNRH